jgi:DNA-binding transcriptional regulator PaaX
MAEFVSIWLLLYNILYMSLINEILKELWDTEYNYKGVRVNIFGVPKFKSYRKKSIQTTINRLQNKGIIEKELAGIILSKYGKEYVKKKFDSLKQFDKPEKISDKRDLLLMFDIPTEKKAHREWLRWHLKKFNFVMIQKSSWVGPFPLPNEFSNYLKEIKLDKCIKTFKLAKPYK